MNFIHSTCHQVDSTRSEENTALDFIFRWLLPMGLRLRSDSQLSFGLEQSNEKWAYLISFVCPHYQDSVGLVCQSNVRAVMIGRQSLYCSCQPDQVLNHDLSVGTQKRGLLTLSAVFWSQSRKLIWCRIFAMGPALWERPSQHRKSENQSCAETCYLVKTKRWGGLAVRPRQSRRGFYREWINMNISKI